MVCGRGGGNTRYKQHLTSHMTPQLHTHYPNSPRESFILISLSSYSATIYQSLMGIRVYKGPRKTQPSTSSEPTYWVSAEGSTRDPHITKKMGEQSFFRAPFVDAMVLVSCQLWAGFLL